MSADDSRSSEAPEIIDVVPEGEARIRVQLSASHRQHHLDRAVEAFTRVGKRLGVLD